MFYKNIKKIYHLLNRAQKLSFVWVLLCMGFSAVLTQAPPLLVGKITDKLLHHQTFESVIPLLILILVFTVFNEGCKLARRLLVENIATSVQVLARTKLTDKLLHACLSFFKARMSGAIFGHANRGLEALTRLIKLLFMDFVPAILTSIAAIGVIFIKMPVILALCMVAVVPVGIFIVHKQIQSQKGIRVSLFNKKAQLDAFFIERLNGIETIRLCNTENQETKRCFVQSSNLKTQEMKHHYIMAFYDALKFGNEAFFNAVIIALAVYFAYLGKISIGTVLTAYLCFWELIRPLRELHRILDELSENTILSHAYFDLLETPQDFSYHHVPLKSNQAIKDIIAMKNITFEYDSKNTLFQNFSLSVKTGEFIGLVGKSGCGKSTLIKLILKLEKTKAGTIYIAGKPQEGLSRNQLANLIATVPQSPFIIAGSVYDNIAYGLKHKPTLAQVKAAAKKACLDTDIMAMGGYDFMLAEGGKNISGGQRQRLALARIFLKKPKILILDEATSALDNTTEQMVQQEIEQMTRNDKTTVIAIAHRLTTLKNCNRIIVLKKGQIVQTGTYKTLLTQPGLFHDLASGKEIQRSS